MSATGFTNIFKDLFASFHPGGLIHHLGIFCVMHSFSIFLFPKINTAHLTIVSIKMES